MDYTKIELICPKRTFVYQARDRNGYLVDAVPQLAEGQKKISGRCCTRDKDKPNVQHTYWEWGKNEASWFFCDHRTKRALFLTTSKPDRRSPKQLGPYNAVLAETEEEIFRIEQEELARLKQEWESYPTFKAGENVPYLEKKLLRPPSSFRRDGNDLMVCFRSKATGEIVNIQRITPDGRKYGKDDRTTKEVYHIIPGLDEVPYVLVAEGAATALACWTVTHATTFSAYSCDNLLSIAELAKQMFPNRKVIICADNDKKTAADGHGNPGLDEASKAAQKHSCILAVPPYPRDDMNWDFSDMLRFQGSNKVLELIEKSIDGGDCVFPEGYELRGDALYKVTPKPKGGEECTKIGGYLKVEAFAHTAAKEKYGRIVSWIKPNSGGEFGRAVLMFKDINSGNPDRLPSLFDSYSVIPSKIRYVIDYIGSVEPTKSYETILQHGWDGDVYALSHSEVIGYGCASKMSIFKSRPTDFEQRGSLEEWKTHVAGLALGKPILTLMLCVGLDGVLHRMANVQSGGIHVLGASSIGKSSGLAIAQSSWSSPDGMYNWRGTDNAFEGIAEAHDDCLLTLDELGQCTSSKTLGDAVYMLGNGVGKSRSTRSGEAREPKRWNISLLSSGELTLEAQLAQCGIAVKAGQEVRLVNIRVEAADFSYPNDNSSALVDDIAQNTNLYYGTAGPEFIHHVAANLTPLRSYLPEAVRVRAKYLCRNLPHCDGQVTRVANRFALYWIAGELAVKFGILPHSEKDIEDAVAEGFDRWIDYRGGVNSLEEQQYIDFISEYFAMHEANFVANVLPNDAESRFSRVPNPIYGYIDRTPGSEGLYIPVSTFNKMMKEAGKDPKRAVEVYKNNGFLSAEGSTRANQVFYRIYWEAGQIVPGGKRTYCYRILLPDFLDWSQPSESSEDNAPVEDSVLPEDPVLRDEPETPFDIDGEAFKP